MILKSLSVMRHPLLPNVDLATGQYLQDQQTSEPLFTNQFFYNGPYLVKRIKTALTTEGFTQELELLPYDLDGSYSQAALGPSTTPSRGN